MSHEPKVITEEMLEHLQGCFSDEAQLNRAILEQIKQGHKKEILRIENYYAEKQHQRKLAELEKEKELQEFWHTEEVST